VVLPRPPAGPVLAVTQTGCGSVCGSARPETWSQAVVGTAAGDHKGRQPDRTGGILCDFAVRGYQDEDLSASLEDAIHAQQSAE